MNTQDIAELGWDERELARAVADFVRRLRRLPSKAELEGALTPHEMPG